MRRTRQVAGMATVAVLLVVAAGCSDSSNTAPKRPTATVFTPQGGETLDVTVGTPFVVQLEADPATGYEWSTDGDTGAVRYVESTFTEPESGAPGAEGEQRLTFVADAPGTSDLRFVYERPFAKGDPAETVAVAVRASA